MEIRGGLSVVQQQATTLTTAKEQLLADASPVTLDEQATVRGSPRAKTVIRQGGEMASQVKAALTTTVEHLHSMTSDSEVIGQEGA